MHRLVLSLGAAFPVRIEGSWGDCIFGFDGLELAGASIYYIELLVFYGLISK